MLLLPVYKPTGDEDIRGDINRYFLSEKSMEKRLRHILKCIIQILIVVALSVLADYLAVVWSKDESIWLGESVEEVGSIICGPACGDLWSARTTSKCKGLCHVYA